MTRDAVKSSRAIFGWRAVITQWVGLLRRAGYRRRLMAYDQPSLPLLDPNLAGKLFAEKTRATGPWPEELRR
jgi:hypothetical protein